ncbi:MAG TPA: L,D-transpeptidase [Solirubrobacteraceae bacterium]|nr:L,D-transpeptidase [Solirubrobacteraceae bacterium]
MARRHIAVAAVVLAVALVAGTSLLLTRGPGQGDAEPSASIRPAQEVSRTPTQRPENNRQWPLGARLVRRVQLRERPGGPVVRALGTRTGYGSERVLAVVARRPGWLGVLSHYMPNSRAGWIPADGAQLRYQPYTLHVDLSDLRLVVRRHGKIVRRVKVAIGRAGHETPTGRFAITDALRVSNSGGPYGCCALALTGRQPNLPRGWTGGDRIAIHGTSNEDSLGTPASAGCLRASDGDMRWLMKRATVGTPVRIRA